MKVYELRFLLGKAAPDAVVLFLTESEDGLVVVDHAHPATAVKHVVWPDGSSGYSDPDHVRVEQGDDEATARSLEAATDHTAVVLSTDNAWAE